MKFLDVDVFRYSVKYFQIIVKILCEQGKLLNLIVALVNAITKENQNRSFEHCEDKRIEQNSTKGSHPESEASVDLPENGDWFLVFQILAEALTIHPFFKSLQQIEDHIECPSRGRVRC